MTCADLAGAFISGVVGGLIVLGVYALGRLDKVSGRKP